MDAVALLTQIILQHEKNDPTVLQDALFQDWQHPQHQDASVPTLSPAHKQAELAEPEWFRSPCAMLHCPDPSLSRPQKKRTRNLL